MFYVIITGTHSVDLARNSTEQVDGYKKYIDLSTGIQCFKCYCYIVRIGDRG